MGMSSSKKTTTSDPYAAAKPAIDAGLAQVQQINQTAQPRIDAISQSLADGFNSLAPRAFGANSFVSGAQDQAARIASGANVGANPGAALYASLMAGGTDPSMNILGQLAQSATNPAIAKLNDLSSGGNNSAIPGLASMGYGGPGINAQSVRVSNVPNLGDAYAARTASGAYLGAQPSAGFYADTLGGKYLNANPYLDAMVQQSTDSATKAANARFAAAGMGEGMSTPYAQALGDAVSKNANALRYQAYSDELARMGQIAGQSDAAYGAERQQMGSANALLSQNANARADRVLDAAKANAANQLAADTSNASLSLDALGKLSDASNQTFRNSLDATTAMGGFANSDRAAQLAAAQALGTQYIADQQTQLTAARSADEAYQAQQAQIMQALGMVPALDAATYDGVPAALQLASAASTLPYSGTSAYAEIINALAGKYGTVTEKSTPSTFDQIMKGVSLAGSLATGLGAAGGAAGGLGAGLQAGILNAAPLPGIAPVDLSSLGRVNL